MKRALVSLFIACLLLIPTAASAKERSGPCTGSRGYVTREMPYWEQQQKVRWLVACACITWPVSGGLNYALSIADRESGLWPYAKNPSSSASGVFQFVSSTWDGLVDSWPVMNRWTGTWVFSARGNVLRAIRLAHELGHWGPWSM